MSREGKPVAAVGARTDTEPTTHEPELVFQVLKAIAQAHACGRDEAVRRFGLSPAQAARLAALSMQELHELAQDGEHFFRLKVHGRALENMLAHLQEDERQRMLQDRLLHLGAPADMMAALFGMQPAECAQRRRALGIGAPGGRPRHPSEEEERRIWKAWQATTGAGEAQRYETVASRCGVPLNVIWGLVRRWDAEGVLAKAPAAPPPADPGRAPAAEAAPPPRRDWRARLLRRADTEGQQTVIRLVLSVALLAYTWSVAPRDPHFQLLPEPLRQALYLWPPLALAWPLAQIAWILKRPRIHPLRRTLGLVHDLAVLSAYLWWLGPYGGVVYVIFLWVIVGHGMRFGPRTLAAASVLGIATWTGVMLTNGYWGDQGPLGWGLLLGLVMIPGYAYLLQRQQLQSAREAHEARIAATSHSPPPPARLRASGTEG